MTQKQNIPLPVVFFLDGHSSHISLHLSQFCVEHGIELVALYPNATHILQPMDVAVFHTLKAEWRKQVQQWRMSNLGEEMKKKDFPPLLQEVIGKLSPSIFENGFRKCGLMPWNPQAVCLEPDQPIPPMPRTNPARVKDFLSYLEHEIGQQKLKIFRNNKGEWSGNKEDLSLYNIWKSNKDKLEEQQIEVQRELHTGPPIPGRQPSMELLPSTSAANEPEEMLRVEKKPSTPVDEQEPRPSTSIDEQEPRPSTSIDEPEPRPSTSIDEQEPRPSTSIDEPEEMVSAEPEPSLIVPERQVMDPELSTPQKPMETGLTSGTSTCNIPSPFKRTLFWPGESTVTPKRIKKEKIPAVLTSPQMMAYYKKKEEGKQQKYDQQVQKKKKREENKKALEEKKRARADKKKAKDQEKQKKQQKENEETDSASNCSSVSFRETDDSDWHEDSDDDFSCQPVTLEELKEGDFVLCEFKGGKRNQTKFVYLCIVQEKEEAEIQVMGLKSQDERKMEFTVNENDISSILITQVLGRLDLPKISSKGERIRYIFEKSVPVREM